MPETTEASTARREIEAHVQEQAARARFARFIAPDGRVPRVPCVNATAFEKEVAAALLEAYPAAPFVATWREHESWMSARVYRLTPREGGCYDVAEIAKAYGSSRVTGDEANAFTTTYLL